MNPMKLAMYVFLMIFMIGVALGMVGVKEVQDLPQKMIQMMQGERTDGPAKPDMKKMSFDDKIEQARQQIEETRQRNIRFGVAVMSEEQDLDWQHKQMAAKREQLKCLNNAIARLENELEDGKAEYFFGSTRYSREEIEADLALKRQALDELRDDLNQMETDTGEQRQEIAAARTDLLRGEAEAAAAERELARKEREHNREQQRRQLASLRAARERMPHNALLASLFRTMDADVAVLKAENGRVLGPKVGIPLKDLENGPAAQRGRGRQTSRGDMAPSHRERDMRAAKRMETNGTDTGGEPDDSPR